MDPIIERLKQIQAILSPDAMTKPRPLSHDG